MTKRILFLVVLAIVFAMQVQAEELPEWAIREADVYVEGGVIYARGSAKMATLSMSKTTAETRARANLAKALVNKEISGYPSIPANEQKRSKLTSSGITVEVGRVALIKQFVADDNTFYALFECNGAEQKKD